MTNSKSEVVRFIEDHKQAVCFLLGIKETDFQDNDLAILAAHLTAKANDRHTEKNGGVDSSFLNDIKTLPRDQRSKRILLEAAQNAEKGEVLGRRVPGALERPPLFSEGLHSALDKHRKRQSRESFGKLADSIIDLKRHMANLRDLMIGQGSFDDPAFRFQVKQMTKMIQSDLKRCDYHGRAGMVWAIKSGVDPFRASNAVNKVYLRHLDPMANSLKIVDQLMRSQGMKSTLSEQTIRTKNRWMSDMAQVLEVKPSTIGKKHEREASPNAESSHGM